jgi:hypothetical protein
MKGEAREEREGQVGIRSYYYRRHFWKRPQNPIFIL